MLPSYLYETFLRKQEKQFIPNTKTGGRGYLSEHSVLEFISTAQPCINTTIHRRYEKSPADKSIVLKITKYDAIFMSNVRNKMKRVKPNLPI